MKLKYVYADPTGNITLLVTSPVPEKLYPAIAARLLEMEPEAEQVGFIEAPVQGGDIRLHMAGGEFCGNASLSSAALSLFGKKSPGGRVQVEVSGLTGMLASEIALCGPGVYSGSLEMPMPLSMTERSFEYGGVSYKLPLVELPGISHLIFEGGPFPEASEAIREWCRNLGASALGIMFLDRKTSVLTPLVYVRDGDTLYWERSCASGTCSAAAWLFRENRTPVHCEFREPGGILAAKAARESLYLIGRVSLEEREAELI